jgi:hypothetical protein
MGQISFWALAFNHFTPGLVSLPDNEELLTSGKPLWALFLMKKLNAHPAWINSLLVSSVAIFDQKSNPRVSVIIRHPCNFDSHMRQWHVQGIPFWIQWPFDFLALSSSPMAANNTGPGLKMHKRR